MKVSVDQYHAELGCSGLHWEVLFEFAFSILHNYNVIVLVAFLVTLPSVLRAPPSLSLPAHSHHRRG